MPFVHEIYCHIGSVSKVVRWEARPEVQRPIGPEVERPGHGAAGEPGAGLDQGHCPRLGHSH